MPAIGPVDLVAGVILAAAGLRGLFNGMIREVFSLLALAAAVVAVRVWNEPVAHWIYDLVKGEISSTTLPWIAGAAIGAGVLIAMGVFGAVMSRGARAIGLGWADRVGGTALGLAEGALVVGVLLLVGTAFLGRSHPTFAGTWSLAALEQVEQVTEGGSPDVAAPPPEPGGLED